MWSRAERARTSPSCARWPTERFRPSGGRRSRRASRPRPSSRSSSSASGAPCPAPRRWQTSRCRSPCARPWRAAAARAACRARPSRLAAAAGTGGGPVAVAAVVWSRCQRRARGARRVADAARLADLPPSGPPRRPRAGRRTELAADVEGVAFPDFLHAVRLAGRRGAPRPARRPRRNRVVYYAKGAAADRLRDRRPARRSAAAVGRAQHGDSGASGTRTLRLEGRPAVTWRRAGHTCVLIGAAPRPPSCSRAAAAPTDRPRVLQPAGHPVAGAEQPARERSLGDLQRSRGLAVGEPGDVHRHQRVAELLGKLAMAA